MNIVIQLTVMTFLCGGNGSNLKTAKT